MRETKIVAGVSAGNGLIVRAEAEPESRTVGHLKNGETVTVLGQKDGRALVSTGVCGWVSTAYLKDPALGQPGGPVDPDGPEDSGDPAEPGEPVQPELPPKPWPETIEGLQMYLFEWGFGPIVGEIDGKNGPKTKEAVKQFQAAMGLSADGIAGPKTFAALKGEVILPRLTETDMACQCEKYCDGYPNPSTAGVRLLVERIWREAEKKYPGLQIYVSNRAHPTPNGAIAGGQRCEQWNKERGGAAKSQHLYGKAADIFGRCEGVKDAEIRDHLEEVALKLNVSGGVGYGARYIVHVDVRGSRARWEY